MAKLGRPPIFQDQISVTMRIERDLWARIPDPKTPWIRELIESKLANK